jgi:hypothetical protein
MAETYKVRSTGGTADYDEPGLGMEILGELVKSYGIKRESNGDWSWDFENVKQAYHDDPFFTALDWAATLPVFAWGKAALVVGRGAGAAGRAYKGVQAGRQVAGIGFKEAMRMERQLAPRTRVGRFFSSAVTSKYDDNTIRFLDQWRNTNGQVDPSDIMHIGDQIRRDERYRMAALQRKFEGFIKEYESIGFGEDEARSFHKLMQVSKRDFPEEFARIESQLTHKQNRFFEKTWGVRNALHLDAQESFLISREVAEKRAGKWWARGYLEMEPTKRARGQIARLHPARGERHFLARVGEEPAEGMTEIIDPKYGITEMFQAAATVERQKTLLAFGNSLGAKSEQEVLQFFGSRQAAQAAGWLHPSHQMKGLLNRASPGVGKQSTQLTDALGHSKALHHEYAILASQIAKADQSAASDGESRQEGGPPPGDRVQASVPACHPRRHGEQVPRPGHCGGRPWLPQDARERRQPVRRDVLRAPVLVQEGPCPLQPCHRGPQLPRWNHVSQLLRRNAWWSQALPQSRYIGTTREKVSG